MGLSLKMVNILWDYLTISKRESMTWHVENGLYIISLLLFHTYPDETSSSTGLNPPTTGRPQPHHRLCSSSSSPLLAFRFFISTTPLQTPSSTDSILYWTVLDDFRAANFTFHLRAFSVLRSAYSQLNQPHKSVEAFARMKEFDCHPDLYTYNLLLRLMVQNDLTILAVSVLKMMLKLNCHPQVSTFNTPSIPNFMVNIFKL